MVGAFCAAFLVALSLHNLRTHHGASPAMENGVLVLFFAGLGALIALLQSREDKT